MDLASSTPPQTSAPQDDAAEEDTTSLRTLTPPEIYIESEEADTEGEDMPSRMVSVDFSSPPSTTLELDGGKSVRSSFLDADVAPLPRLATGSPLNMMNGLGLHLRSCTLEQDLAFNEWTTSSRQSNKDGKDGNTRRGTDSANSDDSDDSRDVNWSALERTEETEVRDGHADEVCFQHCCSRMILIMTRRRLSYWLVSSKPTTHWRQIHGLGFRGNLHCERNKLDRLHCRC